MFADGNNPLWWLCDVCGTYHNWRDKTHDEAIAQQFTSKEKQ